jgi:hypothetical protein
MTIDLLRCAESLVRGKSCNPTAAWGWSSERTSPEERGPIEAWRALFMIASAAIAESPLRQACERSLGTQAGGLATQSVNILFKDASLPYGSARLSFDFAQDGEPVKPSRWATAHFATNRHE